MTDSDSRVSRGAAAVVVIAATVIIKIVDRESFFPGVPFLP